MSLTKALTCAVALLCSAPVHAQQKGDWNGKKCAVSLTYDDALNVHLDYVVPLLDSLGLKGTFYLSGFFPGFQKRAIEWRSVAEKGNELGNHTLFHPCEGKPPGREWVKPDYDLNHYTVQRMVDEIRMANILLKAIDGKSERTFAYPCGDRKAGDSSYVSQIESDFIAARGVEGKTQKISEIDPYDIGSYMISGQSGEELIAMVKKAMETNGLIVFLFHGVGGEHNLNVSLEAHRKLLHFLKDNEKDIWVAPMVEVGSWMKKR
ncbi:MAG: polysaccharide deacetylase family protein [Bacteroidota bacterium]